MRQAVWQIKQTPTLVTYFIQDTLGKQNKNKLSKKKPNKKPLILLGYLSARSGPQSSATQPTTAALAQLRGRGKGKLPWYGYTSFIISETYVESLPKDAQHWSYS